MPRTISNTAIAKLATQYGTEPVTIIEVQWVEGGPRTSYADKAIAGVSQGRIIQLGGLDDVVSVSDGTSSQQISITLDDSDKAIKAIIDTNDVHKRSCWVYQWFQGLDPTDKFLIFKGAINSPLTWDEGARTLNFDVISAIEEVEVGFSIEEGIFPGAPEELIGKPWPLAFGTVINVPALRANSIRQGVLAQGTGIHDFTLEPRLAAANKITCPNTFGGFSAVTTSKGKVKLLPGYKPDDSCEHSKCDAIESLTLQLSEQKAYEISPIRIFGGNQFPQNTKITLDINGGKFIGKFSGEIFTITGRVHPDNDGTGHVTLNAAQKTILSVCGDTPGVPGGGSTATTNTAQAKRSKQSWDNYNKIQSTRFFWATPGSVVTFDKDTNLVYIANLLPSTVLRVSAFRTLDGIRRLATVPAAYYTIRQTNYTGYTGVTEIVMPKALSTRDLTAGGGWEDEIFVTMTSSIGPNTVDILTWFIQTYSSYSIDATSFASVRTAVDNYPMHFPLLDRKSLIQVLQEISYQARCAVFLKDNTFYLKFLAAQPSTDDTISTSDVLQNTLVLDHTPTEELVTKYIATWKSDYSKDKSNKIILRYNIIKYGTHEQTFDYYCFNILELVRKAASFWTIRRSNTWRRAKFSTPVSKLRTESFDCLGLTLPDIGDGTIKAIVEKANYNSDSHTIDFECWTPCRSGTRTPYDYSWTAQFNETVIYPTEVDIDLRLVRAGKDPNFSTLAPKNHELAAGHDSTANTGGYKIEDFVICPDGSKVQFKPGTLDPSKPCPGEEFDLKPANKPDPKAHTDNAGDVSTTGKPGLLQDNPYAKASEAAAKADQAFDAAQQNKIDNQQTRDDTGADDQPEQNVDDAKKKLPDDVGGNCTNIVTVHYITPTLVLGRPGEDPFFRPNPGDTGALADGDPGKIESYTFNSTVAAHAFRDEKQAEITARSEAYGWVVGEEQTWLVGADPDLGIDEDPNSPTFGEPCPEPGAETAAMTAFHSDAGA